MVSVAHGIEIAKTNGDFVDEAELGSGSGWFTSAPERGEQTGARADELTDQ
jgi:hypothetical protein